MTDLGQRDILLTIAKLLSQNKINYLLSGSFASSYYGYPRATHDIDFVIEIRENDFFKIVKVIKSLGKAYLFNKEEIKEAISHYSQFSLFHRDTGIKIDFWISSEKEFEKNKLKRAKEITFDRQKLKIITPEDLILTKLLWCKKVRSERHLRDCRGILQIQKNKLDKRYLLSWIKKLKLEELFRKIENRKYEESDF